jgi:gamma-glutamyl-gamma-aminobutyrate hydrolase PuuD
MKRLRVAVTQRIVVAADTGERRDALDQRWAPMLEAIGLAAVPVPNRLPDVVGWAIDLDIGAVLLTGGDDLAALGGTTPERDGVEHALIDWAQECAVPVLGICRGLQLIAARAGAELRRVDGHVAVAHAVSTREGSEEVNSFHRWGFDRVPQGFAATATAPDGTIEAMRHATLPVCGIMWHPERYATPRPRDMRLLRDALTGAP